LEAATSLYSHRWNPPQFPYIEPLTDASADLLQQRNALNSPRRLQAARGREWPEIAREIVADNGMAIVLALEKAAEINGQFPDAKVHWRELVSLPTPDGVNVTIGQPQQQSQPNEDE
jgi:capsid protein